MRSLKDKKNLVIILLSILFLIKIPKASVRFSFWVLGGVSLCFILDFLINNLFLKRNIFPNSSAIISGFIISGILDYGQPWFVLVTFCFLAILSKHIIKFKNKHIFNPANFGLFLVALFRIPLTWNIESNILLIIIFGLYFTYVYRKFFHVLGFLIFFTGLFYIFKINPFSFISWFFIFIMLIEPKTSGYGNLRGFVFGGVAGIIFSLVFKFIPQYDPNVLSLFLVNFLNPILEKIKNR